MVGNVQVRLLLLIASEVVTINSNLNHLVYRETHPWLTESQQEVTEYSFHDDNPLLDVTDPLSEGLKKRAEGDLPSAVLFFEAEVQARPDSVQVSQCVLCMCTVHVYCVCV